MDSDAPPSSQDRILFLLKTKGPMTASRLARRLDLTSMAVHQHLSSLQKLGMVDFTKEQKKIGRPAHLWALTPKGHDRFPDRHADLAVALFGAARRTFGDVGIASLVDELVRIQLHSYQQSMPAAEAPVEERVAALARIRRGDGFMTEWGRGCDGHIELVEHHCSIAKVARVCPELCIAELGMLRAVLGDDVSIERVEHILSGDPHCAYRIEETQGVEGVWRNATP